MQFTLFQMLEQQFRIAFSKAGIHESFNVSLKESDFGDYQVDGVIIAANSLKIKAIDLASKVINNLCLDGIISEIVISGPGFINIKLSDRYLCQILNDLLFYENKANGNKIVIDYSSPNLAKEMHVGHLRSTIIGDALVRLYEYLGYEVIRRNHVGDWGTQFGMLLAYLLEISRPSTSKTNINIEDLEEFYRQAKIRFDNDVNFAEKARECVVKLQSNDQEMIFLWKKFVNISLDHCQQIYDRLHIKLKLDDAIGESSYNNLLPNIVQELIDKKIATDSNGAICVFFDSKEIESGEETPFIIQKNDNAYLYATTDLAAAYDRIKNLKANHLIYVIDARQTLHLRQLFAVVKKWNLTNNNIIMEHIAFGTMLGSDNKPFKTRSGNTIKLMALIDESVARSTETIRKRHLDWTEHKIKECGEKLGIAAVKYADLSKNRINDYVFSFDKMLDCNGNTAPYLLYAYVRINSIFTKANLNKEDYLQIVTELITKEEHNLAMHLSKFHEQIKQTVNNNSPHYISTYIYKLASLFMRFYEKCPIMTIENENVRNSRLGLSAITAEIIKVSLELLGIDVIDQM